MPLPVEKQVQVGTLVPEHTLLDVDPGFPQNGVAAPGMGGIGIGCPDHDFANAGGPDRIRAGSRAPLGRAGFQRHGEYRRLVGIQPLDVECLQGDNFGMIGSGRLGVAAGHNFTPVQDHRPHGRVRMGAAHGLAGFRNGVAHEFLPGHDTGSPLTNGLWRSSWPARVSGPWPGYRMVSCGRE